MKPYIKQFLLVAASIFIINSCEKTEIGKAPVIPPYETMVIDWGGFSNPEKSVDLSSETLSKINWTASAATVGFWGLLLTTTFAIPVASFYASFGHTPVKTDDGIWEWVYSIDGFTSKYSARLVGEIRTGDIKWEMYISKEGIDPFDEFLWFEGTSASDGNSGQWIMYHSYQFPEEVIQIDWEKEGEEVGHIKYTYTRKLNNSGETDKFFGSYLTYGLQNTTYDAFVNIHAFSEQKNSFTDTFIEWKRSDYSGRIKAEHFFTDSDWHCWDKAGNDVVCL